MVNGVFLAFKKKGKMSFKLDGRIWGSETLTTEMWVLQKQLTYAEDSQILCTLGAYFRNKQYQKTKHLKCSVYVTLKANFRSKTVN